MAIIKVNFDDIGGGDAPSKGTVVVPDSGGATVNLGFEPSIIEIYTTQGSKSYATIYDKEKKPEPVL